MALGLRSLYKLGILLLAAVGSSALAVAQSDATAATTAKIVRARDYTQGFVAIAKDSLKKDSPDLQQARKLYLAAYSDYGAWVAYLKTALLDGKAKGLNTDSEYDKTAAEATKAATDFTNFVDSKTGGSKAANALLSSLGALGLQLWNGVKDERQKERQASATNFEQTVQWQPWEAITDDTLAKPKQESPKSSASTKPSDKSHATKAVPPTS